MHRYGCAVLLSCVLAASALAAEDQDKKSSQAGEAASQKKADPPAKPAQPAKITVKTPAAPAPRVNVGPGTQIGVTPGQIGVTAPGARVGVTPGSRVDVAPGARIGTTPVPRGRHGDVHDGGAYDRMPPGVGVYMPMPLPSTAQPAEKPPAYGNVPAPAPAAPAAVAIPAYDTGEEKKPAAPPPAKETEPQPLAAAPATATPATATPLPVPLAGRYAGMQGRTMHTWEFRPDGTFEHAWTQPGAPAGNATVEAGSYSMIGPYLDLAVWGRATTRSALPARTGTPHIRRVRFGMLGPGAGNAIVLDGVVLKPQNE